MEETLNIIMERTENYEKNYIIIIGAYYDVIGCTVLCFGGNGAYN